MSTAERPPDVLDPGPGEAHASGLARDFARGLADARDLACDLADALADARDLARASGLARAHGLDRELTDAHASARDLTVALARNHGLDRIRALDRELDLDLARALARGLDHIRALARELDLDHIGALDGAIDLVRVLDHIREVQARYEGSDPERRRACRVALSAGRLLDAEEYRSELWELASAGAGRRQQVRYAVSQLTRVVHLRGAVMAPRRRNASP